MVGAALEMWDTAVMPGYQEHDDDALLLVNTVTDRLFREWVCPLAGPARRCVRSRGWAGLEINDHERNHTG